MIRGLHGMFYSSAADATRAFMRDKLELPFTDVGEGWLIFDLPEGDLGVHPTEGGEPPSGTADISFYCDDIHGTVARLQSRGVRFTQEPQDHGYGWVTYFTMPGEVKVQLFEPRYPKQRAKVAAKGRKKAAPKKAVKAKAKSKAARPARAAAKRPAATRKR